MLGRVKPDMPLSKKVDEAKRRLEVPLSHLRQIDEKLRVKDEQLLKRVVAAQRVHNNPYAYMYANELAQVRKMKGMVHGAMLSMEQIQLRLNTVSELGDIVVTLSPCMSVIRDLGPSISGMMPDAASSMQDLSGLMGDLIADSKMQSEDVISPQGTRNQAAQDIMNEATSLISEEAQAIIPDVPSDLMEADQRAEKIPKAPSSMAAKIVGAAPV